MTAPAAAPTTWRAYREHVETCAAFADGRECAVCAELGADHERRVAARHGWSDDPRDSDGGMR